MNVAQLIDIMERVAPRAWAESWDNPGLQVGSRQWPVRRIWIALDPDPRVIAAAVEADVDLLITHHPLIMEPLKAIDLDEPQGSAIARAIAHRLAIFAAHTNLDAAVEGTNDILAGRLDIEDTLPLIPRKMDADGMVLPDSGGIGRKGRLGRPETLKALGQRIGKTLSLPYIRLVGDPQLEIRQIALCTGSGGSLIQQFLASDAQAFITGDVKYHQARNVETAGRGLIDIGHFASEHIFIGPLVERLNRLIPKGEDRPRIEACPLEADPFYIV